MPYSGNWKSIPLYYAIVEELERRGGSAKDVELYRAIRERMDITYSDFLKALMVLEMQDVVYVETLREDLRSVRLVRKP
jgi:hypothetical protein